MIKYLNIIYNTQKSKDFIRLVSTPELLILLTLLEEENLIKFFKKNNSLVDVFLKKNVIKNVYIFSKPGRKAFIKTPVQLSKNSVDLIKTSQGLMSSKSALKFKQGGEHVCKIFF